MSTWLEVTLTTRQRVSLGTGGQRAYLTRTYPFIPGSVFRGALAAAWLVAQGRDPDAEFRRLFDGDLRFSPLHPEGSSVGGLSIVRCKYHAASAGHPRLVDRAFGPEPTACPGAWEALKGDLMHDLAISHRASTALAPGTITAAQSQLFTREVLERGTQLRGWVVVPDAAAIEALTRITTVFVGGKRGTLGRSDIRWRRLPSAPEVPDDLTRVVLRSISPTILVDAAGRPSLDFGQALRDAGLAGRPENLWADRILTESTGGWHMASGLPKPSETALSAGATAVLERPHREALLQLIDRGLGLRRGEGFGWLQVASDLSRPGQSAARPTTQAQPDYLDAARKLDLPRRERDWAADQLRRLAPTDITKIDEVMKEAGARWITNEQLDQVRWLLLNTPIGIRASLARFIEEEK